jgi:superkiller protein 3
MYTGKDQTETNADTPAEPDYHAILGSLKKIATDYRTDTEIAFIFFSIAQVLFCLKRHTNALTAIKKAAELDPDNAPYWILAGDILMAEPFCRYTESLDAYEKAAHLQPDNPAILIRIGNVHEICQDPEEAIRAYDSALAIAPDDPSIWSHKGCALNTLFYRRRRKQQLRNLSQNISEEIALLNTVLSSFQRALELEPQNPDTLYLVAQTLAHMERYDEALKYYDTALENLRSESPPPLQIWYSKAEVLEKVGRNSEAGELFERYHAELKKEYDNFMAVRASRY